MLRLAHAWFWVAAWLYLLGRGTQAFPIGVLRAVVLGAVLTPGIYGPLRLLRRERRPDLSGDFSAPVATAVAGLFISFVVLGFMSLMGFWDVRPRHAATFNLALAVVLLHGLAGLCIALSEYWMLGRRTESY